MWRLSCPLYLVLLGACLVLPQSVQADDYQFIRGDADGDLRVNIADAIMILRELFGDEDQVTCLDAIDVDDSGGLSLGDAIYLLEYQFTNGDTPPDPGPDECGSDPSDDDLDCLLFGACGYPPVSPPADSGDLLVFEPFNYRGSIYSDGLDGHEGGFGFSSAWIDDDGDVEDRVLGDSAIDVDSDMAPQATGGRAALSENTGSSIYRDLADTYGADDTTIWISLRWQTLDDAAEENLQIVDFNNSGEFNLVVGQIRGLCDDDLEDEMFEVGHHPELVSEDIASRDGEPHFLLMRISFGEDDEDSIDVWWDPATESFDEDSPSATIETEDASFSRVTFRAYAEDRVDELRIGTTLESVTEASPRFTSYHIGNSLTADSLPDGIEALSGQFDYLHDTGYHIKCAESLEYIWDNPEDTCVTPMDGYGYYTEALEDTAWDAVTMQPYSTSSSTLLNDESAILDFIDIAQENPDNAATNYYIYQAWPGKLDFDDSYQDHWESEVDDDDDTSTILAREYFNHLVERVREETDAHVYVIPVGEVLYELDLSLRDEAVDGLESVEDLFRDDYHLTLDVGRFVAAVTTFTVLLAQDPDGIVKPSSYYGVDDDAFSSELYDLIDEIVWNVVVEHEYTGVRE